MTFYAMHWQKQAPDTAKSTSWMVTLYYLYVWAVNMS